MLEWAYDGVNSSIPRNVGPECLYYISPKRRIIETSCVTVFIAFLILWGYKRITLPKNVPEVNYDRVGRRILLLIMSMVLGMELGFKFTSRTVIYILNPCHITTMLQLYLLVAKPSPKVTVIFRIHLNLMNGAVLAFLFPETESRKIFADQAMYYIQHGLMLVIPYYLLKVGGVYTAEPLLDMSWSVFSYGFNLAYHFLVLQIVALPFQVNLSHMLCAALLDPFGGQNYRLWAVLHEGLLCPLMSKFISYTSKYLIGKHTINEEQLISLSPSKRDDCNCDKSTKTYESSSNSRNGHTHLD